MMQDRSLAANATAGVARGLHSGLRQAHVAAVLENHLSSISPEVLGHHGVSAGQLKKRPPCRPCGRAHLNKSDRRKRVSPNFFASLENKEFPENMRGVEEPVSRGCSRCRMRMCDRRSELVAATVPAS